ncbi:MULTISPECIES: pyridoxamine 5'-phosphate oxidase family protein [Rhodococcus]|uniref:Pyridoxamine 5'-phosphate oxidase family protein n=1 Tax=Rhodococcus oxybenzonivorans TaxID=1990687 RepID=A0AAE4UXY2_9NOCA|nr:MULTISPECIES: pyridoxamine 5'-phosphate oxidase family protein [Rhodococcus]MDV7243694.1 pyridoxamine 5'-phosphate oxidase family protein [Rhodococcus oxybenzonivorans]MDV7264243.1 pyridoxamine 5'-phosphate oxidase family protein [Rhodococcus oxybenzonivorans]MDV7275064.1 pyridoxamine 5'-phosphate oxidase family protein [Rhodococcus oxybenzonivorans]MDV7335302.1 pyridoxamine 5'-phosphate oxidase family protein [Rhodococcus oxybenzonivorans]MDV7346013.1 pyridoxamine 5'-phosphate oxidase fami
MAEGLVVGWLLAVPPPPGRAVREPFVIAECKGMAALAKSDAPLPEAALTFLRKPNPAVMATVTSNGRPVSVATWYLREDDGLLMLCMNADRARLKHLQNNGHVSLTVLAADDFGTHVSIQGHVVSIRPDEGLGDIDRLSRHFLGKDYPARERPLVTVHVEIDRWFGWSGGRPLEY